MKKLSLALLSSLVFSLSVLANSNTLQADPFEDIQKMQTQIDKIFSEFHKKMMKDDLFANFKSISSNKEPLMDLKDLKDHYEIKIDMPGVDKNGINISVKDGLLKIEAKREESKDINKSNFIKKERFFSNYVRVISIPKDANTDKLKTNYKNGVLTVDIPKK